MNSPAKKAKKGAARYVVGIDEAGRGPLAGPVAVGIFMVEAKNAAEVRRLFKGVRESKQLTAEKREAWFAIIKEAAARGLCIYKVMLSSAKQIDAKGIAVCIRTSIADALSDMVSAESYSHAKILLDGGLKAPEHFKSQKTIIKGDEKEMLIALASICAKVTRDRRMVAFAGAYPAYDFEIHKGYGTARHIAAIRKHGLSALHRRSFTKRFQVEC